MPCYVRKRALCLGSGRCTFANAVDEARALSARTATAAGLLGVRRHWRGPLATSEFTKQVVLEIALSGGVQPMVFTARDAYSTSALAGLVYWT